MSANQSDFILRDLVGRFHHFPAVAADTLHRVLAELTLADLSVALEDAPGLLVGRHAIVWHPLSLPDIERGA